MPGIPIVILTPNGVVDAPFSAASLAEAATKEPQGVYTLARTYDHNRVLLFNDHLDRLEYSAELEGISVRLDRDALRVALRNLIEQAGYDDARFRITVSRKQPDHVFLALEPFKPVPPDILERGARVITVQMARPNPVAKTTAWVSQRTSAVAAFPDGIYEGILLSPSGQLLEGTSSNFYAIKNRALWTADDSQVLSGIARRLLLTVAPDILKIRMEPIHVDQITTLDEALLTSSGRGVVPIVEIDGHAIGDGKPGPYTRQLREAYNAWAKAHLESI
jgi:branched-subunit amino acid aminotransferase/4-amino-4-deoxychorismate lyase